MTGTCEVCKYRDERRNGGGAYILCELCVPIVASLCKVNNVGTSYAISVLRDVLKKFETYGDAGQYLNDRGWNIHDIIHDLLHNKDVFDHLKVQNIEMSEPLKDGDDLYTFINEELNKRPKAVRRPMKVDRHRLSEEGYRELEYQYKVDDEPDFWNAKDELNYYKQLIDVALGRDTEWVKELHRKIMILKGVVECGH